MAQGRARENDTISHGGNINTPSQTSVKIDGLFGACVGDPVTCSQHGAQTIVSGSSCVTINGQPVARIGDLISCGATIITGSSTCLAD